MPLPPLIKYGGVRICNSAQANIVHQRTPVRIKGSASSTADNSKANSGHYSYLS